MATATTSPVGVWRVGCTVRSDSAATVDNPRIEASVLASFRLGDAAYLVTTAYIGAYTGTPNTEE